MDNTIVGTVSLHSFMPDIWLLLYIYHVTHKIYHETKNTAYSCIIFFGITLTWGRSARRIPHSSIYGAKADMFPSASAVKIAKCPSGMGINILNFLSGGSLVKL